MMSRFPMLTLCAAGLVLALAGCNRQGAGDTAKDTGAEPSGTAATGAPAEGQRDAGEPGAMPQTQPTTATATPMPGMGPDAPAAAVTGATTTLVASRTPGPGGASYLTDSAGNALYMLEGNRDGAKCTGACLQAWPPLLVVDVQPTAGAGLEPTMVAVLKRPDGATQVTYNGQPLHRYAADMGAGHTNGHGVKDQWGQWVLVMPDGSAAKAK